MYQNDLLIFIDKIKNTQNVVIEIRVMEIKFRINSSYCRFILPQNRLMSHLFYSQRSILLSFSSTPVRAIESERNQQSYGKLFNLCSYRLLSDIISFNSNKLYRVIFVLQFSNVGQPSRLKQNQNTHCLLYTSPSPRDQA